MAALKNKIDFVALISVTNANGNGDPLNGNRPRTDYNGMGELSDVCIKRKLRNRMQDMGNAIFVQSEDRCDDGFKSLSDRATAATKGIKEKETYAQTACEKWMDVRSFGQVFAFKSNDKSGVSVGVRGPVSIHQAVSISPVEIEEMQITKSVNGETGEKRSSDTMGTKHFVRFGFYEIKGAINVHASAARPEGSMEVVKLFWWEHNCKEGQYSSAKVHRSVHVTPKNPEGIPTCVDDYEITLDELPGLVPEIIDGV